MHMEPLAIQFEEESYVLQAAFVVAHPISVGLKRNAGRLPLLAEGAD